MRLAARAHPRLLGGGHFEDISGSSFHHERAEGNGYPNGLSGDEIPLEARILSVADAYEAMTATGPPVRDRRLRGPARSCDGAPAPNSDARVVRAFLEALEREHSESAALGLPAGSDAARQ